MMTKAPLALHGHSRGRPELETLARECAAMDAAACEAAIAEHALLAIRERRIDDAVFWQRVKFRSRLLRAMARGRDRDPFDDDTEVAGHGRGHWA